MISIIKKLSDDLILELKKADEIWVAVGLLNNKGLELITEAIPKTCKMNFIIGIDLPTDPKALSNLLALEKKRTVVAKIFDLKNEFFHPKVYIIKSGKQLIAFVGSANCTNGGLEKNIEMSISFKDKNTCKQLIDWFQKYLLPKSQTLDSDFIKEYKPKYEKRIKRQKIDKHEIIEFKNKENKEFKSYIKSQDAFIKKLKLFRATKKYQLIIKERQQTIRRLKKSLDYPNFVDIDLEKFLSIRELGTIPAIKVKKQINQNTKKFTQLLKFICNETIPLKDRIDEGLNGKYKIDEVKEALLSKILVMHNPKKYFVRNRAFLKNMKSFGLSFPRGIKAGERYIQTRNILQNIITEIKIGDFAILDGCLFDINN